MAARDSWAQSSRLPHRARDSEPPVGPLSLNASRKEQWNGKMGKVKNLLAAMAGVAQ